MLAISLGVEVMLKGFKMGYFGKAKDWVKNQSKYWITDNLGIMCEANIAFAAYDKWWGFSNEACWSNRALATTTAFVGVGYLFSKVVDVSDKVLKIDRREKGSKLREAGLFIHDAIYSGAVTLACSSGIYHITNYLTESSKTSEELFTAALVAGGLGILNGGPAIYSRDVFRDLTGLKKCERNLYPDLIKNRGSKTKKFLAAGFVAASLGIVSGIIELVPSRESISPGQLESVEVEVDFDGGLDGIVEG